MVVVAVAVLATFYGLRVSVLQRDLVVGTDVRTSR